MKVASRPPIDGPRIRPRDGGVGASTSVLGDERTFRAWYDEALPRVYGYLFNRCGRDRDLAEELTQQTFFDAFRTHTATIIDDPFAWVIGIARHRRVDRLRALERRERGMGRLIAQGLEPGVSWIGDLEPEGVLVEAMRSLPAAQRAAITLRYIDDLPVREVAALMGRSEGAVESLLSRGREALRRATGDER